MIPRCNTRFAKVKFRLKTTQLKTIFNDGLMGGNCPGGQLFWQNYR